LVNREGNEEDIFCHIFGGKGRVIWGNKTSGKGRATLSRELHSVFQELKKLFHGGTGRNLWGKPPKTGYNHGGPAEGTSRQRGSPRYRICPKIDEKEGEAGKFLEGGELERGLRFLTQL